MHSRDSFYEIKLNTCSPKKKSLNLIYDFIFYLKNKNLVQHSPLYHTPKPFAKDPVVRTVHKYKTNIYIQTIFFSEKKNTAYNILNFK